ncbi:hypothetical protein B5S31_g3454 [[Candida] boidinii]|nr:hypothetical protein B5S31_g3454 [[Candida] boidinii]
MVETKSKDISGKETSTTNTVNNNQSKAVYDLFFKKVTYHYTSSSGNGNTTASDVGTYQLNNHNNKNNNVSPKSVTKPVTKPQTDSNIHLLLGEQSTSVQGYGIRILDFDNNVFKIVIFYFLSTERSIISENNLLNHWDVSIVNHKDIIDDQLIL